MPGMIMGWNTEPYGPINVTEYHLPIIAKSPNETSGEHWSARSRRAKSHHKAALIVEKHPLPCVVTLIRCGTRSLDGDNLQGSLKWVRDAVAARLGVDDADPRVEWRYGQQRGRGGIGRIES